MCTVLDISLSRTSGETIDHAQLDSLIAKLPHRFRPRDVTSAGTATKSDRDDTATSDGHESVKGQTGHGTDVTSTVIRGAGLSNHSSTVMHTDPNMGGANESGKLATTTTDHVQSSVRPGLPVNPRNLKRRASTHRAGDNDNNDTVDDKRGAYHNDGYELGDGDADAPRQKRRRISRDGSAAASVGRARRGATAAGRSKRATTAGGKRLHGGDNGGDDNADQYELTEKAFKDRTLATRCGGGGLGAGPGGGAAAAGDGAGTSRADVVEKSKRGGGSGRGGSGRRGGRGKLLISKASVKGQ